MIIKSISVENFQCYSGTLEDNTFEFREGLNVIIGDNGSGKSKLYDAFYWLLYDKIFNSSTRDLEATSIVKYNLISDKVKYDCEVGETVSARVVLVVEDSNSRNKDLYRLERSYSITKIKDDVDFNNEDIWKSTTNSITKVEKKDILNFKPMTSDSDFDRISRKLVPVNMKPYLWFQGEQVDSLIDFKNEKSLTDAINTLSDISYYDNIIEVAKKSLKTAQTAYDSEVRRNSKNTTQTLDLQRRKESLEKTIETDRETVFRNKKNLEDASLEKDELLGKIQDAQDLKTLTVEEEALNRDKRNLNRRIEKSRQDFNNKIFKNKWILRNAGSYVDKFEQMLKDYDDHRGEEKLQYRMQLQHEEAKKHRLPDDVPNKVYLQDMMKEKHCFLCDREFHEGDHAFNYINDLLQKTKSNRVHYTDFLRHDLSKAFRNLLSNGQYLNKNYICDVDNSIMKEIETMEKCVEERAALLISQQDLLDKINNLLSSSSVKKDEIENIISSFTNLDESKERWIREKALAESRIQINAAELNEISIKLQQNLKHSLDQEVLKKKELLEAFKLLAISTRDKVYNDQIKIIEEEANKHFNKMTKENRSARGRIILEKIGECYMPKNVDQNGIELTSINDSNLILIKLATIMAIVSSKGKGNFYPLITDAPTSKFSDNYTIGFCNTVGEVYSQSIIISYDFYHNLELRKRLFSEVNNLGAVYEITPSINEENRANRTSLSTNIKTLN